MTSVVIDNGGPALEFDSNEIKNQEENEPVSEFPAVVVEPVPSARLEQGYAAQVLVYDDETYLMQDVAEEQEIETETVETDLSPLGKFLLENTAESPSGNLLMEGILVSTAVPPL